MKKLLLLLLLPFLMVAQTIPSDASQFENLQITNNVVDATSTKVNVQDDNGVVNWRNITDFQKEKGYLSTGLLKNGLISINVDITKFNITAGIGIITNFDNPEVPTSDIINFGPFTGITPAYLTTSNITYLAVNSSGTLIQQSSEFTTPQRRDLVLLGAVIHSNLTSINVVNNISAPTNAGINQLHDLMNYVGPLNLTGNKYTANGANLALDKSAGSIFKFGVNFATDWKKPHELNQGLQTALTFRYRQADGTEGTDRINLDPSLYELNNVLTTVPNNNFTIQTVTMFQTGLTRIQRGQTLYATLDAAERALLSRDFVVEPNIKTNGITRSYIILRNSTTSLLNTSDAKVIEAQKYGGVASGGVALTLANIVTALGYTPENIANKQNSLAVDGTGIKYPTVDAVNAGLNLKANLASPTFTGTVSGITKSMVGLANVDNTSDVNKPVSTAQQTALNGKVATTLLISTTSPLVGGGDLSSNRTLSIPAATTLVSGHLSSTDWNTFNSKISNATHTGDATGSTALTLATVNANVGTFGNATNVAQSTVNAKGLTTAIANVPIQISESQVTSLVADLAGKEPAFAKNTGFNKNFGAIAGTVVEGNDSRLSDARTPLGGSASYIQNQSASAQAASSLWTSGVVKTSNQLVSTIATGTAPLTVASTTVVPNLNADLLDGQHASAFQLALTNPITGTGATNYIPKWTGTGTQGNSLLSDNGTNTVSVLSSDSRLQGGDSVGRMLFGNSTLTSYIEFDGNTHATAPNKTSLITTTGTIGMFTNGTEKVTVLNNGNVGIGTTTPTAKLDVNGTFNATGAATFSSSVTAASLKATNLAGTGTRAVVADASGNLVASTTGYKVYTALLTQTGTAAPVATVLDNTLGGTVVWTRSGTGIYGATLNGAFVSAKTWAIIGGNYVSPSSFLRVNRADANIMSVVTESGGISDGILENTSIEIRVYN